MSVSCPETIFFSPKWQDSGCGLFRVLTFQEHKLLTCQEPGMLGVGNPFSEKMFQKHVFFTVWEPPGILKRMKRMNRMKAKWYTTGNSDPRFLTRLRPG